MPQIDFERRMVIVAAMGGKPSTGFGIRIDSVLTRGSAVEVHVVLGRPSGCLEGQVFTAPVDIVEVARSGAIVLFRDREITTQCKMSF
jgi:hypothetical protein